MFRLLYHFFRIYRTASIKKSIPIIYLPWWHNNSQCNACKSKLTFTSDCQKYCANCFIFYIGCRYCLTTNIIFGPTNQSQCKKCKRISTIDITNFLSGNVDLDDFLVNSRFDIYNKLKISEFADKIKNIDKYFLPYSVLNSIYHAKAKVLMKWIPYSQFTDIKEIAKGGFGIIYQATLLDGSLRKTILNKSRNKNKNKTVILKRYNNSQDFKKYFLNEVNI